MYLEESLAVLGLDLGREVAVELDEGVVDIVHNGRAVEGRVQGRHLEAHTADDVVNY